LKGQKNESSGAFAFETEISKPSGTQEIDAGFTTAQLQSLDDTEEVSVN
jgi:hypothetical protein